MNQSLPASKKLVKVLKFGGTSMGSVEALTAVKKIITATCKNNFKPVVVCSAMSGVTNQLFEVGALAEKFEVEAAQKLFIEIKQRHIEVAECFGVKETFLVSAEPVFNDLENLIKGISLIHELSARSNAYLTGFGEKLSTRLLNEILKVDGGKSQQLDAHFIKLKGLNFEEDEVDWEATKKVVPEVLEPLLQSDCIPIVTGFFGTDNNGVLSLLGRGGSDYSGAILTVGLKANALEIWTDVDGFLSADPRLVSDAQIIEEIGFEEAAELCFFGAKVLHPKTIRPVIDAGGEVWIKNTFNLKTKGTCITKEARPDCRAVVSISSKKVCMVSLDVFAATRPKREIFSTLFALAEKHHIPIDMVASSEAQISFCVEERFAYKNRFWQPLEAACVVQKCLEKSVVCIVSPKEVKGKFGVAGQIFTAMGKAQVSVDMYSQNASEVAQLVVVDTDKVELVVKAIHKDLISASCTF